MAASKIASQAARAAHFQMRCECYALAPVISVANDSISTPDQPRSSIAAIDDMFDLQLVAPAILANPIIIQRVQATGDPEGEAVPDGDIKIAVRSVTSSIGATVP